MPGRIRSATCHRREELASGWEAAAAAPGAAAESLQWRSIGAAGTVAAVWSEPGDIDAQDWWYRLRFSTPRSESTTRTILGFDGLATPADAWINGRPVLSSDNMFVAHELPLDDAPAGDNELVLRFRSLDALLALKRPRPRWRVPMVKHQQLRWVRTTLLGRTPGWSPPTPPVGPWRPVWLETRRFFSVGPPVIRTAMLDGAGLVDIQCTVTEIGNGRIRSVRLVVQRNGTAQAAELVRQPGSDRFSGQLRITGAELWWPHTHGEPALHEAALEITSDVAQARVDLGSIGFRSLHVDTLDGEFAIAVNGVRIFCRGACWMPLDCNSLQSKPDAIDRAIDQVTAGGMNMLRASGATVYESDAFLDACDARGVLLWQDLMFANMDYPVGDATFDASVALEVEQLTQRLAGRPCIAVLCGNSEVEQQAAMWGADRERWAHPLFEETLPSLLATLAPDVPYWPSSAHGGAFPHQANAGTTSYYGVGAYRRPLTDARHAEIRFATECLGFANVPEENALAAMPGGASLKVHHPQWKARSPRDLGAGWDFDDVRDHYLAQLFGVQALDLRYSDHDRYLDLSRVASAEAMAAAFRDWRRERSSCNGALIWFLRDLWPGAGWGIVDALGEGKAPYFLLRQILKPQMVLLTDEGVNGLDAHLFNESPQALQGELEIALFRAGEIPVGRECRAISVPARSSLTVPVASMFAGFIDLSYAYRFGPPPCDLVVATLSQDGQPAVCDFHFPTGHTIATDPAVGLTAEARMLPGGDVEISIRARRLARHVTIRGDGFQAEDQYFHVAPGMERRIRMRRSSAVSTPRFHIRPLNATDALSITAS